METLKCTFTLVSTPGQYTYLVTTGNCILGELLIMIHELTDVRHGAINLFIAPWMFGLRKI